MAFGKIKIGKERTILLYCLGIALVFWFSVKLSRTYETTRTVFVEYRLPPGFDFAETPPASIQATFSGTGWNLMSVFFSKAKLKLIFDLTLNHPPVIQQDEIIAKVKELTKLNVAGINRSYFSVALDPTSSVKVPVRLEANLAFAPDYYLRDSILVIPDSVVVSGPHSLIREVKEVLTEPLLTPPLGQDFQNRIPLVGFQSSQVRLSTTEVEVFIPVEQYTEKTFTVPVQIGATGDSIRLFPSEVKLKCIVGLRHFEEIGPGDFRVEADLSHPLNLKESNTVALNLAKSSGLVRSVSLTPQAVEFFIVQ